MLSRLQLRTTDVSSLLAPRATKRGHNLLEVMIASLIFSTALVFMLGLWRVYHSALTQSKNRLVASSLARSVLEQRMAGGYGALTPILNTPQEQSFVSKSQVRGRMLQIDFKTIFIATDSSVSTLFRRLVVRVEWDEDSRKKSISYETCLFKAD